MVLLLSRSHFQGGPVTEGDLITEVVLSDTDLLDFELQFLNGNCGVGVVL